MDVSRKLVNHYSCIDIYSYSCLHPLSNERKSMFKSGDSRAVWTWVWTWKYLKWALHYFHDVVYGKRCGPDWSFRRRFCSRKRCVRLWRCDDVVTFESTQPTPFVITGRQLLQKLPWDIITGDILLSFRQRIHESILFREIQCKKMNNLMLLQRFQRKLGWNKVNYARITITHVCFIALTLAGPLGKC